jgi:peptidoglycan/LPS O-acetylase OafA/YrhL
MTSQTRPRSFVPALEGLRGLAALGVLVTHVAFQTGSTAIPVLGALLGRLDLSVAVFFALSGFLLWRGPAAAAREPGRPRWRVGRYLRRRAARVLPAYWVTVSGVLALLPGAGGGWTVWWANLTLTQVFVPLTLTTGLTQLWSLSVEATFYLVLPVFARLSAGVRTRRALLLGALATVTLGWAFLPIPTVAGVHATNWLPGYLPWFGVGMVWAELAADPPRWFARLAARPRTCAMLAATAFGLAATGLAGPVGLATVTPARFATKVALGAVFAGALLLPLVGDPAPRPLLTHPVTSTLGRWSYGVFLWHVAVLAVVFPVFAILPFHGDFAVVLTLTTLLTLPLAAASYGLVEEPARGLARGSAVTPSTANAVSAGSCTPAEPPT